MLRISERQARARARSSRGEPGPPAEAGRADRATVTAILAGDEAGFRSLVEQNHRRMVRLARCFVSSEATAEEVVQETWLAVIQGGLERWEGRASLRSWILAIVANRARSRGACDARTIPFSAFGRWGDEGGPALDPDRFHPPNHATWPGHFRRPLDRWPSDRLESRELLDRVRTAIEALPPQQRAVITMRDVSGCESAEACAALGISEGNQRVILHRARCRVRAAIDGYRHAAA